jgi:rod shape-determining protein MreD
LTDKLINVRSNQVRGIILLTYLVALIIDSMVLLNSNLGFIPPITLMIVLYWSSHFLDKTFLVSAFLLGVMVDALYQTTLGAHALLYIIILFIMMRQRLQFRTYPTWQQAFIIGIYLMIYQVLNTVFFSPVLDNGQFVFYWSMPAAAILIWPSISALLNRTALNNS